MEEPLKYFVPEISDIRVGYEGEALLPSTDNWKCDTWTPFKIDPFKISFYSPWQGDGSHLDDVLEKIRLKEIRTPYLTKEQIEAEGWETEDSFKDINDLLIWGNFSFRKGNYIGAYNPEKHNLTIILRDPSLEDQSKWEVGFTPEYFRFSAYCPSINEFRYITNKLLKIDAATKTV